MSKTKKRSYRKRQGKTLVDMEIMAERMGMNKKGGMDQEVLRTLRKADDKMMDEMMKEVERKRKELGIREKKEGETHEDYKKYEDEKFQEIWDEGLGSFVNSSSMKTSSDSVPSSGAFADEKGFPTRPFLTKEFFQNSMSLNREDQIKVKDQIRSATPQQNLAISKYLQSQLDKDKKGGKKRRRRTLKKKKTKRKSRKYRKRINPMDIPE